MTVILAKVIQIVSMSEIAFMHKAQNRVQKLRLLIEVCIYLFNIYGT